MIRTVWKYPLEVRDEQTIKVPEGSLALSVIAQNNVLTLYCCVDTESPIKLERVVIMGTGQLYEPPDLPLLSYLGTVPTYNGNLVWHVFTSLLKRL